MTATIFISYSHADKLIARMLAASLKDSGLDVWIVDALRYRPHPSHFSVEEALTWIDCIKPGRAILTNLHADLDYEELRAKLNALQNEKADYDDEIESLFEDKSGDNIVPLR